MRDEYMYQGDKKLEIGTLIMVKYLDHCFDDSEKSLEEIREDPLIPPQCTVVGFKTYEDGDYITVSSEITDHGEDSDHLITYTNHVSLVKNAILNITPLTQKI
jgi:hypothetical protein